MTGDARSRRWRPVLLSGLVLPGLGQAVTGHPWRALFFSGSSLALVVVVVERVARETRRLMPEDPVAVLDPMLPFNLVAEIHRANASFFFWATLGMVALWVAGIVDAYLATDSVRPIAKGIDRARRSPGPSQPKVQRDVTGRSEEWRGASRSSAKAPPPSSGRRP
jgi:hypothetical protein